MMGEKETITNVYPIKVTFSDGTTWELNKIK